MNLEGAAVTKAEEGFTARRAKEAQEKSSLSRSQIDDGHGSWHACAEPPPTIA